MRAVLDTNVLVSALISPAGVPATVIEAWRDGRFELVSSPALLAELEAVPRRPRIRRSAGLGDAGVRDLIALIAAAAIIIRPRSRLSVLDDDADNRLLQAVTAAAADYLVTGDGELLARSSSAGADIVTPLRFRVILSEHAT
jgi:putative PIN family toxin of toxin-antitoxin system